MPSLSFLESLRERRNQLPEGDRKAYMIRCLAHAITTILPLPKEPVGDYLQYFLTTEQRKVSKLVEAINEWEIVPIEEVVEAVRAYMNYRYQFAYPQPQTMLLLEKAVLLDKQAIESNAAIQVVDADMARLTQYFRDCYEPIEQMREEIVSVNPLGTIEFSQEGDVNG